MNLYFANPVAQLYQGDAQNLNKIADKSIDLIVTDPPYGIGFQSAHRQERFDPIISDKSYHWLLMNKFLHEAKRVLVPGRAIYIFTGWNTFHHLVPQMREIFKLGHPIAWGKDNWSGGNLEGDWANRIELIIYAMKGQHKLIGDRPSNLLLFKRVSNKKLLHPAEKPVGLLAYLISKSCPDGGVVLDPFMGSASTIQAAIETGRKAIGVDIDEKCCQIAKKRIERISIFAFPKMEIASQDFQLDMLGE